MFIYLFKKNFLNVLLFIFETERDRAWTGEGQSEGDTESEAGSRLQAVSTEPDLGLKLTNHEIVTWAEVGCLTNWATQAPQFKKKLMFIFEKKGERQNVSGGRVEREGDRIWSRLQAPSCQHRAWHGAWTHEPRDHDLSQSRTLNWLNHLGAPEKRCF